MSRKTDIIDDPDELNYIPTYKELFEPMQGEARPFYGEVRDESLTPITSEYLLKDRNKMDDAFRKIVGHLNSLRIDRIGKAGVNVISVMEPVDAQKYIDERLDTLGDINKYVVDMMDDLESEEAELLNTYQDDITSMKSLEGNLEKLTLDESNEIHKLGD